ncbi:hypothetical protein FNV43_RR10293 [Rhamnella rubrinervis]|uniref:Uncharacterized protein n=1 Tax=Rhamnella rubrinervis TaxID=2594499 RepID=A0A8K0HCX2_9ROSA|nr:hypothetical protein FNV43_RR10293 [Rhamnella rubrinervis]
MVFDEACFFFLNSQKKSVSFSQSLNLIRKESKPLSLMEKAAVKQELPCDCKSLQGREKERDKERTERSRLRWGHRGTETRIGKGTETETVIDTTKTAIEIEVSKGNVEEMGMMTMMITELQEFCFYHLISVYDLFFLVLEINWAVLILFNIFYCRRDPGRDRGIIDIGADPDDAQGLDLSTDPISAMFACGVAAAIMYKEEPMHRLDGSSSSSTTAITSSSSLTISSSKTCNMMYSILIFFDKISFKAIMYKEEPMQRLDGSSSSSTAAITSSSSLTIISSKTCQMPRTSPTIPGMFSYIFPLATGQQFLRFLLPHYFTEVHIKELLESFGPLRHFDLVKDRETVSALHTHVAALWIGWHLFLYWPFFSWYSRDIDGSIPDVIRGTKVGVMLVRLNVSSNMTYSYMLIVLLGNGSVVSKPLPKGLFVSVHKRMKDGANYDLLHRRPIGKSLRVSDEDNKKERPFFWRVEEIPRRSAAVAISCDQGKVVEICCCSQRLFSPSSLKFVLHLTLFQHGSFAEEVDGHTAILYHKLQHNSRPYNLYMHLCTIKSSKFALYCSKYVVLRERGSPGYVWCILRGSFGVSLLFLGTQEVEWSTSSLFTRSKRNTIGPPSRMLKFTVIKRGHSSNIDWSLRVTEGNLNFELLMLDSNIASGNLGSLLHTSISWLAFLRSDKSRIMAATVTSTFPFL